MEFNKLSSLVSLFTEPGTQLEHYLFISGILFTLGLINCLLRNNAVGILIGIELILNSAILNFMAFWHFLPQGSDASPSGPLAAIFIIVLVACESAVALAMLLNLNFKSGTIEVDRANKMKN
ncbi:MAG: NADH-quinone oxidoreductase subunit NuoK [Deltaproteobacteria bacterium]|jgi:NADH-quinone oxidoreductase subunit K|nr:NADH-quinone oxidoreductase subunit NuoK [Deltaproteobacteria bacterium]